MGERARLIVGVAVVGALTAVEWTWLREYAPRSASAEWGVQLVVAGAIAIGLVGGLLMRSRWSLVLAPATILGATEISAVLACAACSRGDRDGFLLWLLLQLVYQGLPAALGAAGGTLAAIGIAAAIRRARRPRPAIP